MTERKGIFVGYDFNIPRGYAEALDADGIVIGSAENWDFLQIQKLWDLPNAHTLVLSLDLYEEFMAFTRVNRLKPMCDA